jgi:hypothetical protein
MGMDNYTPYQQKVIKRYYDNAGDLGLQKLAEWVTDLYLAEGKKKEKLWQSVAAAMLKLGVPKVRVDKIVAAVVTELQGK